MKQKIFYHNHNKTFKIIIMKNILKVSNCKIMNFLKIKQIYNNKMKKYKILMNNQTFKINNS